MYSWILCVPSNTASIALDVIATSRQPATVIIEIGVLGVTAFELRIPAIVKGLVLLLLSVKKEIGSHT